MSRIRLRQKQLLLAGAIGGAIILLLSVGTGYLYVSKLQQKNQKHLAQVEAQLSVAMKQLNEEKVTVTVMKDNHLAGEVITDTDLTTVSLPRIAVPEDVADQKFVVGKYAKIDLQKNTFITKTMLFEEGVTPDDLRNQEFRLIQLPLKLTKRDFVDVRIKFPTGQDYIILSKKKVDDLNNGTVWYQMNETEILSMSSAIVDAFVNDATIYALSYVDPYMQEKAQVNYPFNSKIQELIQSDPNIIDVATQYMEKRAREKLEQDLKSLTDEERQKYLSGKGILESNNNVGSSVDDASNSGVDTGTTDNTTQDSTFTNPQNSESPTEGNGTNVNEDVFKDNDESVSFKE